MAQLAGARPATSGTCTMNAALLHRVDVVQHHAAVLAVIAVRLVGHTGTLGVMEIEAVARES
jgi:hypothetical protein